MEEWNNFNTKLNISLVPSEYLFGEQPGLVNEVIGSEEAYVVKSDPANRLLQEWFVEIDILLVFVTHFLVF